MMKTYTILKARIYAKKNHKLFELKIKKSIINIIKIRNLLKKKYGFYNFFKCVYVIVYLVHIFFDDAFKPRIVNGKPGKGRHVNEYVKLLEKCVPNTAKYEFIANHSTSLNLI